MLEFELFEAKNERRIVSYSNIFEKQTKGKQKNEKRERQAVSLLFYYDQHNIKLYEKYLTKKTKINFVQLCNGEGGDCAKGDVCIEMGA